MSINSDKAIQKNLTALLDPEQFLDILDLLGVCLFMTDLEGRYTFANQPYMNVIGVESCADLLGQTVFDLYDETIASQYHAEEQSTLRDGTPDITWGLLIMQERTEAIDGRFKIDSALGKGTTVTVKVGV